MHPAYSIILFTTASGAGYGLIISAAIAAIFGILPYGTAFTLTLFSCAGILIFTGLLSSTLHLGHPERAWRAFSQWKSSWLSREGVAVMLSIPPIKIFVLIRLFAAGKYPQYEAIFAILSIILSLGVIWCTGMIYASLKTIRQWNKIITTPIYLIIGCASGAIIFSFIMRLFRYPDAYSDLMTIILILIATLLKIHYWKKCDQDKGKYSIEQATGLATKTGKVHQWEQPHTAGNFVMQEMGYKIGRKHGEKLRKIVLFAGFIPAALWIGLSVPVSNQFVIIICAGLALLHMIIAVLIERWLFFAQAQHVVTLYYGAARA